jgi:hypothetical protein
LTSNIPLPDKKIATQNKFIEPTPKIDKKIETQPKAYPSK